MRDRTEPLAPYEPEPEPSYEWDYEDERRSRPKVLWGRIVILAIVLFLAYLLGRSTAPEGIPESTLEQARAESARLEQDNQQLAEQIDELEAAAEPSPSPTNTTEAGGTGETGEAELRTYTVQRGDTLRSIAQDVCEDPSLADAIGELNGISDPQQLPVGSDIDIPEDCNF
jgi:nucleoid-associated protein YgaU